MRRMSDTVKYAIKKTFKGRVLGTTGAVFDTKEKADKICEALNDAKHKYSDCLNYTVIEI